MSDTMSEIYRKFVEKMKGTSFRKQVVDPYVEQMDGFERLWFMMQMNEKVVWLY